MIIFCGEKTEESDVLILRLAKLLITEYKEFDNFEIPKNIVRNGKPQFENSLLKFSLSHSDNKYLLGFSKNEIGVDIEKMRDISETQIYKKLKAKDKQDFFEKWTKYEAIGKYYGTGIVGIFSNKETIQGKIESLESKGIKIHTFSPIENFVASIVNSDEKFSLVNVK